jgi:hypothetical protein
MPAIFMRVETLWWQFITFGTTARRSLDMATM